MRLLYFRHPATSMPKFLFLEIGFSDKLFREVGCSYFFSFVRSIAISFWRCADVFPWNPDVQF